MVCSIALSLEPGYFEIVPDDFDITTRCWQCRGFLYHDNFEGVFLDDGVYMCGGCIRLMDGVYSIRRYTVHPDLLRFLYGG